MQSVFVESDMHCSLRTHYEMSFFHDELVNVGFNPTDLIRLHRITGDHQVKFRVYWDKNNEPHFHYEKGHQSLKNSKEYGTFYYDFVTWSFNKTKVKGYRVIHFRNRINLLFGHNQDNVNPVHMFPDYDFTGFQPHLKKHPDGSSFLHWGIQTNKEKVPKSLHLSPTSRPIS